MDKGNVILETKAAALPDEWDELARDNLYLQRKFLAFVEGTEADYKPTYYLFYDGERLDSLFVAYRRKGYNLAMFTPVDLKIKVTLIYLPMCVTASSIIMGKLREQVLQTIRSIKGYKMTLNLLESDMPMPAFATGLTCPKCILDLPFASFDDYLSALRGDYRNRAKKVLKRTAELEIRFIDNQTEFDDELYRLYLNVLEHSRVRIETLSKAYFSGEMFKIFVAYRNGKAVGFVQLLPNGEELIFEFVGIDYACNAEMPVYHRMMYEIVRYGIGNGYKTIDYGQTADDTKLKLGCRYVMLYAALHHSNPLVNGVCKLLAPKLQYRPLTTKFHVFKET
jgi:hypothetical protein